MSRRQWPDGTSDLEKQVDHVRADGFAKYKDARAQRPIPLLMRAVQTDGLPLRSSQVSAELSRLFAAAIARLDSDKRRAVATELFGLRPGSPDELGRRTEAAYEVHTGEWRAYNTIRTSHPDFDWELVADVAAQLKAILTEGKASAKLERSVLDSHVPRLELQARCRALIHDGARVVVLAGDTGTGKSTLARDVAHEIAASATHVVEIDADPEQILYSLVTALDRYQVSGAANWIEAALRFARLLRERSDAPQVLIVDNVEDERVIRSLIPADAAVTVIVVSRRTSLGAGEWPVVTVGCLTPQQATQMVNSLLPALEPDAVQRLVYALGGNPLAIDHVCRYLGKLNSVSLDDFLLALEQNAALAFDLPRQARPLSLAYRLSLDQMNEHALRALDIILSAGSLGVHFGYIADLWTSVDSTPADIANSPQLAKITLVSALGDLEERSLIRCHDIVRGTPLFSDDAPGDTLQPARFIIGIHSLTQRILHGLRSASVTAIRHKILARFDEASEIGEWALGRTLSLTRLLQLRAVVQVLLRVGPDKASAHPRACALALRCAYQMGQMPIELADTAAIAWHREEKKLQKEGRNPGASPLSVELVRYMRLNQTREYSDETWKAFWDIRRHNSGLWHSAGLLHGNEWTPALALGASPQFVLSLANKIIAAFWKDVSENADSEVVYHARQMLSQWFYIRGTIQFDIGLFEEARVSHFAAWDNYDKLGGSYRSEQIDCFRRLSETDMKAGDYRAASQWQQDAVRLTTKSKLAESSDYVLTVRHKMVNAQVALNRAFRQARKSSLPEAAIWLNEVYDEAIRLAEEGPLYSLYPAAKYGSLCAYALTDSERAHKGMCELVHWCSDQRWYFAVLRSQLAAAKLRAHLALEGDEPGVPRGAAKRVLIIARSFRRKYHAFYWYADALATALALGSLGDASSAWMEQVRTEAVRALAYVGRLDKLEVADQATSAEFSALQLLAE